MHNLTYQERARFAYADGNTELAEALEMCAEQEAIIESHQDHIDALNDKIEEQALQIDELCEDVTMLKEKLEETAE